jgi:fumarylacetoacetate (FAA) hydrolase
MKLATLKDGSRDGQLVVVSRDLRTAVIADAIVPTLQRALDDWTFYAPQLLDLSDELNQGRARHAFAFDAEACMAPLPRAFQWADGSSYVNHVELVRRARNAEMPPEFWTDPLMYQGGSDDFLGPEDDIVCGSEAYGIDFEAEVAVITTDVPMTATPAEAPCPPPDAGQRRVAAQSHPGGTRQRFRFFPEQAGDSVLAGRRHA